ncbi:hypothetical protein PpBr36_02011 [Pyricularia pennisetigena]|uniref:hypothetical protein n=1 Tax=Pyricularia pennisetigena TaxID=1578925 RepID=UPI001151E958|nr:hypothetical protein PpBr36_02011 [Pyricularia pennisetigena]TLS29068.1 hypothetical protein PpBr36_02011 [Pyricularia pennisetigena]
MIPARIATRSGSSLVARLPRQAARSARGARQIRFQSTSQSSSSSSSTSSTGHVVAGAVGGLVAAGALYGAYSMSPTGRMAKQINKTAKDAESKYNEAAVKLREKAPSSADEAIESMKKLALSYAAFIPGAKGYVEAAFADVKKVQENHGEEVDRIVQDAYKRLQAASKSGFSMETASKAWDILADVSAKMAQMAGDAAGDVLDNHPQLKEKIGGNVDKLKSMSEQYGPEAKKMADETWTQVKDIVAGGLSAENIAKAKNLVDDKVQQVQKLGDEAWKKGLEQVKPLLEKNPKIKELVENNADALKKGNVTELISKAKSAVDSGDAGDLEKYVKQAVEKAQSMAGSGKDFIGGSLEQYLGKIPNGPETLAKLQQLGEVASKHKDEGEKLLKETIEELKQVLEKKAEQAEQIKNKAQDDAKKAN